MRRPCAVSGLPDVVSTPRPHRTALALAIVGAAVALVVPAAAQTPPAPPPPGAAPGAAPSTPAEPPPPAVPPPPGEAPSPSGPATGSSTPPIPGWAAVPAAEPRAWAPTPHPPVSTPDPQLTIDDRRTPPDYDGRDDVVTAGEAALWVPRVALFPLHVASEYVVRRPVGALTVWVEEGDVIRELEEFFTFGPNNNIGIVPTGFLDFGFRPSVGVYFFWNEFLHPDNAIRANVATGGSHWYRGILADRIDLGDDHFLQLEVDALERPDLLYWGEGPRTLDEAEGTYGIRTAGGGARLRLDLGRKGSFVETWALFRASQFVNGGCDKGELREGPAGAPPRFGCHDPTILEQVEAGRYDLPAGFDGYSVIKSGARLVLDSRRPRPAPGHGVAFDFMAEPSFDPIGPEKGAWVTWGATGAAFLDLTGTQRVLSLSLTARFADPLTDDYAIPFAELVGSRRVEDVPDGELLHGFRPGRLLGRSAAVAALEYRWPVWAFIDGVMQAGVGNTYGEHLEDFDPGLLRFAFSGGVRSSNHRDHSFNLLLGFGTETFAQGADLTSIRFLFGGTTGF